MKYIILLLLTACVSAPVSRPLMYNGAKGKCPLVILEFGTYPGHSCYCRIENEQSTIQIYLPVRNQECNLHKTTIEEVE